MDAVEPRVSFGASLRRLREAAGLTQEELAERSGLTAKGISALERGERRRPYPQTVRALADALGLDEEQRSDLIGSVERRAPGWPAAVAVRPDPVPLPRYHTRLIGRDADRALILEQILDPSVRLLTLVGPGGVGKTRLAVDAAEGGRDAFDAVWFCDLSDVRRAEDVAAAVARAGSLTTASSVAPLAALERHLADRRVLIVLDNLEHVLDAAGDIARLLAATRVTILATSREAIRIRWERVIIVHPLDLPDLRHLPAPEALLAVPAIALFVERATASTAGFRLDAGNASAVAGLCARLDGLPLAIELVAARAAQLGAARTLDRLDRRRSVTEVTLRDAPERHRSLRSTFEWSLDLLPPEERELFIRFGAFVGGWRLEEAQAVAAGVVSDVLERSLALVDKSLLLVVAEPDAATTRFGMLDTAREIARDLLVARPDATSILAAHAAAYATFAEEVAGRLTGSTQAAAVAALEREEANIRSALTWAAQDRGPAAVAAGLRLTAALGWYWFLHGYPPEARSWFDTLIDPTDESGDADPALAALLAKARNAAGFRATDQGEYELAASAHAQALATWRIQDSVPGLVASLHGIGDTSLWLGRSEDARRAYVEGLAIARERGAPEDVALFEFHLGQLAWLSDDLDDAEVHATSALEVAERAGSTTWPPYARFILASVAHERGDVALAGRRYREALRLAWDHRDRLCVRMALPGLAALAIREGDPERAVRLTAGAASLETSAGIWAFPPIRARHERWMREALAALDDATERDAWAEGSSMPIEDVIDEALALPRLPRAASADRSLHVRLSAREREVLDLVAAGYSNPRIAEALVVTPHTAKYHVTSLLNKLGANTRAEAVARAAGLGLIGTEVG